MIRPSEKKTSPSQPAHKEKQALQHSAAPLLLLALALAGREAGRRLGLLLGLMRRQRGLAAVQALVHLARTLQSVKV